MYDISAARNRISSTCSEVLRRIDDELKALTESVGASANSVERAHVQDRLQFAIELAVLRERMSQLAPMGTSQRNANQLAEAAAEFLRTLSVGASGSRELPKIAYNRVEAGTILGMSPMTVDRLVARGLLRASRATRRPMFTMAELERYMRETS